MASLLDIKKAVATNLGQTDYSTTNTIRDIKINDARREFYTAKKWSFLKKNTTLTFSAGVASFPTNYNPDFDLGQIYSYSGTDKTVYTQVELEDLDSYATDSGEFVYAIDRENSQFKSNQQSTSPQIAYYQLPADKLTDGSEDSDEEPAGDITPIILLATAMLWLSDERDEDNYDRFFKRYTVLMQRAIFRDNTSGIPTNIAQSNANKSLGFNEV